MVRWSGEVQVNVSGMSNLNLSLTLVDVKLVSCYFWMVNVKDPVFPWQNGKIYDKQL